MRKVIIRVLNVIRRAIQSRPVYVTIRSIKHYQLLENKCVMITGGGKGIGFSIAKKIISCGGKVILIGRDESALKKAVEELGSKSSYLTFDLNDIGSYGVFMKNVLNKYPDLNSLVLNAGVSHHEGTISNVTIDGFEKQIKLNFMGCYFLTKEYINQVKTGNLLFISSETAEMGCEIPYGLSKSSLNSFIKAIGVKYIQNGIRANGIAPGQTISNMVKNANSDLNDLYRDNSLGRYTLPDEIAEVATFLLSDASTCISGEVIHTNAGNHLRIQ